MVNIKKLMKLSKEELVDEIRKRDFMINNLRKELKTADKKWMNFYRSREYNQRPEVKEKMKLKLNNRRLKI